MTHPIMPAVARAVASGEALLRSPRPGVLVIEDTAGVVVRWHGGVARRFLVYLDRAYAELAEEAA